MIRNKFPGLKKQDDDHIKWRNHEVTRIEAFSDAVFAFAITLLIISLEVPKSADELFQSMKGFFPFGICFLILFGIWREQNLFFRRYGLHDGLTITLNGCLLFVILFYVYPLKFLFSAFFQNALFVIDKPEQTAKIMCIYSAGYTVIFILFALMYSNSLMKKDDLKLTNAEIFVTRTTIYQHIMFAGIGVLSVTLAMLGDKYASFSGIVYFLIGPGMSILHSKRGKRYRLLYKTPAIVVEEGSNKTGL